MSEPQEEDDAPAGQPGPAPLKRWFMRFTEPVVIVASVAAMASATFAYQTNAISQRQVELLNRQVSIEESLALPVFTVSMDVGATSHRITIENNGGLANDLVVEVLPFISFWWDEHPENGQPVAMQGDELPLVGYFDEYGHVLPGRMNPGARTELGFDGNADAYRDVAGRLTRELAARDGVTGLDHALEVMIGLRYIDYMGVERADFYIGQVSSAGEVFPPRQFMRVDASTGDEIMRDYYEKFDSRFMLVLDPETSRPDDDLLESLGTRIYTQRFSDVSELATPTASAVS